MNFKEYILWCNFYNFNPICFYKINIFSGTLNTVESYMSIRTSKEHRSSAGFHYGTWASLVHSLANWKELKNLRPKIYPERLPTFKPKLKSR